MHFWRLFKHTKLQDNICKIKYDFGGHKNHGIRAIFFGANHLTTLLSGHLGTSSSRKSQKILLRFMSNKNQIKTFSGSKDIDLEIDEPPNSLHNQPFSDHEIFMKESVFYYQKLT